MNDDDDEKLRKETSFSRETNKKRRKVKRV